ncbi:MAG: T9SS type A sorting domain-containing protein, partial [Flavobacteriales bacterium]
RPNPSKEVSTLRLPKAAGGLESEQLYIMDITGEVVKRLDAKGGSQRLDVSDLESGVYFVHYESPIGGSTQKLMVQ